VIHAVELLSQNLPIQGLSLLGYAGRLFPRDNWICFHGTEANTKNSNLRFIYPKPTLYWRILFCKNGINHGFLWILLKTENPVCSCERLSPLKREPWPGNWSMGTGLRAEQSANRSEMKRHRMRMMLTRSWNTNPLLDWTFDQSLKYIQANKFP